MRCRWLGAVNRDYYIQQNNSHGLSPPAASHLRPPPALCPPALRYLSSRFTYSTNSSLIRRFPTECCLFKLTNCLLTLCSCGTVTHLAGSSSTYPRQQAPRPPRLCCVRTVSHSPTGSTPPAAPALRWCSSTSATTSCVVLSSSYR